MSWAKCEGGRIVDDHTGLTACTDVNVVLHYVYLALLVMCFLLAMGNRPQGELVLCFEKWRVS